MGSKLSVVLAGLGFVATAISLALPWWVYTYGTPGTSYIGSFVHPFSPVNDLVDERSLYACSGVVVFVLVWLVLRFAATSWKHEWQSWRRDLAIMGFLLGGAAGGAVFWPKGVPFWGQRTLEGGSYVAGWPWTGWYLIASAAVLLLLAAILARAPDDGAPQT